MTLVGLLGEGITTSLTPPMHRREAELLGIDYEYRTIDIAERGETVDDLPGILAGVAAEGYDAINVTHPFKQRIIPHLDELSEDAATLGAVNLVVYRGGRSTGHNTDWTGFRHGIMSGIGDIAGQRVLLIGAGGAGAAAAFALLKQGVSQLVVADRYVEAAERLRERMSESVPGSDVEVVGLAAVDDVMRGIDGLVHATPTGMHHQPGIPVDPASLAPAAWLSEIVYLPLETELVRAARGLGHVVLDGGRMAVGQAADSIRIITGLEPDRARMREHFVALVGEPSSRT